jgi:hypothetical protein
MSPWAKMLDGKINRPRKVIKQQRKQKIFITLQLTGKTFT